MSDDKFKSAEDLKVWLINRGVDSGKAASANEWLFPQGYDQPSTLIGIHAEDFDHEIVSDAVARHISNKFIKEQQQDTRSFPNVSCTRLQHEFLVKNKCRDYADAAKRCCKQVRRTVNFS